jgi:hypothetical protein
MSNSIFVLAAARADLVTATEKAEAAHAAQTKLLTRKAESEAAAAAVFSDYRAGKITEEVAALRKAGHEADAADLAVLIEQGAAALAAVNAEQARAQSLAAQAETAARNEELALVAKELDTQIQKLEQTFLAAIAERGRIYAAQNPRATSAIGSTFNFYKASQALDALVRQNAIPRGVTGQ